MISGSAIDSFASINWNSSDPLLRDRIAYWRPAPVGYAERALATTSPNTGVFIVAGQSNGAAYGTGSAFTPVNAAKVDSLSIFSGGIYEGKDPGPNVDGLGISWVYRLADKLITAGEYQRVVMVPVAMGSATCLQHFPEGLLGRNIPAANARCQALGLPVTAVLWQQGESESIEGVSAGTYQARLQTVIDLSRASGVAAPWLVGKSTYQANVTNDAVRAGLAAVVNGSSVFAGADTDTLTGATYRFDGTHFNATGCNAAADLWQAAINAVL